VSGMLVFFTIIGIASLVKRMQGKKFYDVALKRYSQEQIDGIKAVWNIFGVFAFIPFFWALYDQNGSEWVLQVSYMDTMFLGINWLPQQVQAINPILILVLIPLFSILIFPGLQKLGIKVTPLRKITVGFFIAAFSFIVIALIQESIDAGGRPNIVWQLLAFFILTVAEVLISITGLEYAYTKAPKTMKSVIMSFWLLTVSIGNILVTIINNSKANHGFFERLEGASYYWFFVGVIVVTGIAFMIMAIRHKDTQGPGEEPVA
jgi:POT family proton-dependent oligopeptide transporter